MSQKTLESATNMFFFSDNMNLNQKPFDFALQSSEHELFSCGAFFPPTTGGFSQK